MYIYSKGQVILVQSQRQVSGASELQPQEGRYRLKEGPEAVGSRGRKPEGERRKGAPLDQVLGDPFSPPGPSPKTHLPETDSAPLAAFESLAVSKQPLGPNQNTGSSGLLRKLTGRALSPANSCVLMSGKMRFLFITGALKIAVKWPTL